MARSDREARLPSPPGEARRLARASLLLGLALGAFFDGVLLHQILQWHHLLSGLEGGAFADLRVQMLADGLFHAAAYFVAAIGLTLLWRARRGLGARGAGRLLLANLLIGFGAWHALDAVFSHWLTQIHRIRMDSDAPLLWDLLWLAAFGLAPAAIGLRLRARGGGGGGTRGAAAALVVALAVVAAGAIASLPPRDAESVMVYFRPGVTAADVFAAAAAADARIIWSDGSGALWALAMPEGASVATLYRHGALFVGSSFFPAGCLSWSRPA